MSFTEKYLMCRWGTHKRSEQVGGGCVFDPNSSIIKAVFPFNLIYNAIQGKIPASMNI